MFDQEQALKELHTLRDFIRWSLSLMHEKSLHFGHGQVTAWDEAVQLVLGAVHLPWDTDSAILDARLLEHEKRSVLAFVDKRVNQRIPLPYITKEAWFAGLPFNVDERVLIPRSPIAQLIQTHFEPFLRPGPVERVLDLCTGSGCIGIACAYAFEGAAVDLADISADALAVAQSNIERHGLTDQVAVIQSDLFSGMTGSLYDLIVANPPYVDAPDLATMPAEYHHEPELALASGADGLDITRRILREANDYLADDGLLLVEVGNSEVHLMAAYPQIPFIWVDLPEGGNGVFAITAADLKQYRDEI